MKFKACVAFLLILVPAAVSAADSTSQSPAEEKPIAIIDQHGPQGVQQVPKALVQCGDAALAAEGKGLSASPGRGVVAATKRVGANLRTSEKFGDCKVELEFLIGKGSNSGVKLQSRYEVQIYDSHGRDNPTAKDCGGVYPHWLYRQDGGGLNYIDEGFPPLVNAAKPAGEWQTLEIVFRAPRFSADGKKIKNARFDSVVLNGKVVQEKVELTSPTGHAKNPLPPTAKAPLYLQMDHGPVAFRNVRVTPLAEGSAEGPK
ncbi:DUF1080 domain-containing protein [Aeoliella sp. ICT_H6.2]|uniref:DUF1080 domain-containing protein n=1 Tax=Aeoliella straminimaris TaxID=2954799 RepID=A0A9X2FHT1_9BACT|nr:DUF1080 domain-containing protein [Aeoliella straminimaris]MCO6045271.1 DUF1080 domain-containing protein [Aeoliella straminimaris]